MTKRIIINAVLFLVSVGWLVPVALAFVTFDSWVWLDVFPVIYNKEPEMHSFPYYQASEDFLVFGFWWFCIVFVGWAGYLAFYRPFV